jgi:hypothetical protein
LQSLTELIGEIVEFAFLGKGTQDDECDFPFSQIGILDDIREIFRDDGLEDSEEWQRGCSFGKVGLLSRLQEVGSASD